MKAIILDYSDGSVNLLPIPKDMEENTSEYVENVVNTSHCSYMIHQNDSFPVYEIIVTESENGNDFDTDYGKVCEL